jgi:ionotropic glutamate receptor
LLLFPLRLKKIVLLKQVWLSLLLFALLLPIVLWKDLTFVWKTYQKAAVTHSQISPVKPNVFQEKSPALAKQYFFILGVLIGQCIASFVSLRLPFLVRDVKSSLSLYDDLAGQKLSSIGFSPRLLGAFWCLSAVVFASAYVGILVGFLSFPRLSPIIGKLEELPGSKLGWGVHRGTALETLFTVLH